MGGSIQLSLPALVVLVSVAVAAVCGVFFAGMMVFYGAPARQNEKTAVTSTLPIVKKEEVGSKVVPGKEMVISSTVRQWQFQSFLTPLEQHYDALSAAARRQCLLFADMLPDKNKTNGAISVTQFRDLAFKNLTFRTQIIDDENLLVNVANQLEKNFGSATDKLLYSACKSPDGIIFVSYRQQDSDLGHRLLVLPKASNQLVSLDLNNNVGNGGILDFVLADFADDQAVIRTGYGDAGSVWWRYYLVRFSQPAPQIVEDCNGEYITIGDHPVAKEEFHYRCKSVYSLQK